MRLLDDEAAWGLAHPIKDDDVVALAQAGESPAPGGGKLQFRGDATLAGLGNVARAFRPGFPLCLDAANEDDASVCGCGGWIDFSPDFARTRLVTGHGGCRIVRGQKSASGRRTPLAVAVQDFYHMRRGRV